MRYDVDLTYQDLQSLDYTAGWWEYKKKIYYENVTLAQILLQESGISSIRVNL